jgi:hypothetical protein
MPNIEQIETLEYDATAGAQKVEVVGNTAAASSVRVTSGPPAAGQTIRKYNGKQATSTSAATPVALYTVTAGKTFYITDIFLSTDQAGTPLDVAIQAAGGNIFNAGVSTTSQVQLAGIDSQPSAAASQAVTLLLPITTAVQNVWYFIAGFEQ